MGETADRIVAAIRKKEAHYPSATDVPVHLIVYPTDFRVSAPSQALSLVQIALNAEPPASLEQVFWVEPTDIEEKQLRVLFPADISRYPLNEVAVVRAKSFLNFDPAAAKLKGSIGGVSFEDE